MHLAVQRDRQHHINSVFSSCTARDFRRHVSVSPVNVAEQWRQTRPYDSARRGRKGHCREENPCAWRDFHGVESELETESAARYAHRMRCIGKSGKLQLEGSAQGAKIRVVAASSILLSHGRSSAALGRLGTISLHLVFPLS